MKKNYLALSALMIVLMFTASCSKHTEDVMSVAPALSTSSSSQQNDTVPPGRALILKNAMFKEGCGMVRDKRLESFVGVRAALSQFLRATSSGSVTPITLFVEFNGGTVTSSAWTSYNNGAPFAVPASGITNAQKNAIFNAFAEDFAAFKDVKFTMSGGDYNAAPANRRMICYVTTAVSILPQGPGWSVFGSLFNTPNVESVSFVQLNYTSTTHDDVWQRTVGTTISHEFGHCFGLYHHARWNGNQFVYEYEWVLDPGTIFSRGTIMGNGSNCNFSNFGVGRVPDWAGGWIENDYEILGAILGFKADDEKIPSAGLGTSQLVTKGMLGYGDQMDSVYIKRYTNQPVTLTIESSGNICPIMYLYRQNGNQSILIDSSNLIDSYRSRLVVQPSAGIYMYLIIKRRYIPGADSFDQPADPLFGTGHYIVRQE